MRTCSASYLGSVLLLPHQPSAWMCVLSLTERSRAGMLTFVLKRERGLRKSRPENLKANAQRRRTHIKEMPKIFYTIHFPKISLLFVRTAVW